MTSYAEIYEQAIANGAFPLFADMLASRKAPAANSDREFFAGHTNGSEAPKLRARAKKMYGFTPGPGDVYVPGLAPLHQPYHPQAWVPPGGGRGHVKKVCELRGWGCSGAVKAKFVERPEPVPVKLADSIVNRIVKTKIKKDPGLAVKPLRELKESVIDQYGPKY